MFARIWPKFGPNSYIGKIWGPPPAMILVMDLPFDFVCYL